ncbi:uncharacterized protein LOC116024023 [Ipomoea triloba]|uniref:uncharacterized protein LOC116024023 n=1 Tax=Ipomoea triloba TaxID=35885 RepID=UPI00125E3A27|nr:uncharacterized protein LOC116024023 [Ipomoea triloba]
MQINRSNDLAVAMSGGATPPSGQWIQQESLQPVSLSDALYLNNNVNNNNNICAQMGKVFPTEFLQDFSSSSVVPPAVIGVSQKLDKSVKPHSNQNKHVGTCSEELGRVLGLTQMDSDCGSGTSGYLSARGSMTELDNALCMKNQHGYQKSDGSCEHGPWKAMSEPSAPTLKESECFQSLQCMGLGSSDSSQTGKVKFLCSFGGKILPRPSDGKLRYAGGETRIISMRKNLSLEELMKKTFAICKQPHTIKYQLPGEDLDALISVSSDEDLLNMIEEYHGLERLDGSQRLRVFLIPLAESENSCTIDASTIQQSDPDYQYVVAINGIIEADHIPQKNCNEKHLGEASHLVPNINHLSIQNESSPVMQPGKLNDGLEPNTARLMSEAPSKVMFPNQSTPFVPMLVQQGHEKSETIKSHNGKLSHGTVEGLTLFDSNQVLSENSDNGSAACIPGPQVAVNFMASQNTSGKVGTLLPSEQSEYLMLHHNPSREFVASSFEHYNCNFERSGPRERVFSSAKLDVPVHILGSNDSIGSYNGLVHCFSDSKLQEHGNRSAYSSQELIIPPLNSSSAQLPSQVVSAALLEKPVLLPENADFANSQLHFRVQSAESTVSNGAVDLLKYPFVSEPFAKGEFVQRHVNDADLRCISEKEDLMCPSVLDIHGEENHSNSVMINGPDVNGLNGKVSQSTSFAIPVDPTKNFLKVSSDLVTSIGGEKPAYEMLIPKSNFPESTSIDLDPLICRMNKQPQNNQLEELLTEMEKDKPDTKTVNFGIARTTQSSSMHPSGAHGLIDLLSELPNGPVAHDCPMQPPVACTNDKDFGESLLISCGDLHPPSIIDDRNLSMTLHSSALLKNHVDAIANGREVSLLDDEYANFTGYAEKSTPLNKCPNEKDKILDGLLDTCFNGCLNSLANDKDYVSPIGEYSPAIVHSVSTVGDQVLSPGAIDGDAFAHDMGFGDVIQNDGDGDKGDLITDAMIAEFEADLYGLQIIKNDDLEELRELGAGTYGTVYHGKWRGTDVAIKRLKKACFSGRSSEEKRLIKDFWREAQILSNLHHPNVVAFYGVVPDGAGGTLATVTEFMANGSLRSVLHKKDRSLDCRKKLLIAMDAAFGMEYLHLKNIVHFDLKCDNLLVNLRDPQRPICKVGDFGLSRIKRNTLVSGGVRGTLPWMAPELLNGNTNMVSEKVDVFSFGITMWEILTGEEPYANMHCGAIIGGILKNTLRPPIPERCDPEWRKLMEQCWHADPESRPSFTVITDRLRSMSAALEAMINGNLVKQMKPDIAV